VPFDSEKAIFTTGMINLDCTSFYLLGCAFTAEERRDIDERKLLRFFHHN
jgi:hypothetical protein